MAEDQIRYDVMTQAALRGVVRSVLEQIAKTGLPGEHHLYIAFDTHGPGVSVSNRLMEQYPDEMTIVLQHQFWDLEVSQERFEVKLSFNNIPERLVVPFTTQTIRPGACQVSSTTPLSDCRLSRTPPAAPWATAPHRARMPPRKGKFPIARPPMWSNSTPSAKSKLRQPV